MALCLQTRTDARQLTHALGGKWFGRYGLAFCPAHHNTDTPALSLSMGREGQLLAKCHAGCSFTDIISALDDRGMLGGDTLIREDHMADQAAADRKRTLQAKQLARETLPMPGTIAETYLRGRGITCPLPDALRFHPNCWHPSGRRFPAMVARVMGSDDYAVHRTYLKSDGIGKAEVEPAKAMLGNCAGGAVRLVEGNGPLVVAEGIETALSLGSGLLHEPRTIWAALSTSGMRALRLPAAPDRLTIAVDGDRPGREAAHILAERAHKLGWTVSLLQAPEGKDWNDILRETKQ